MEQLPTILGALVLAGVLWLLKTTDENGKALAVLQRTVDGIVLPELTRLRESGHDIREIAQQAVSATELLKQRTTLSERDIEFLQDGNINRRAGTDRRDPAS